MKGLVAGIRVGLGLGLAAVVMLLGGALPATANTTGTGLVISQVYGGGGNTGATYTNDFVEIFNPTTGSVSLTGFSVQYASATGTGNFGATSTQITDMPSVSLAAGQYFLIQEASNAAVGSPLPAPDHAEATPIAMAAGAGKVALVNTTTPLGCNGGSAPCSASQVAMIVDLVGYGTANFFEGTGPAPTISATTSDFRAAGGCTDTDDNGADFTAAAVAPRNTASPLNPCPTGDLAPAVSLTAPLNGATNIAVDGDIAITFSEPVNVAGAWFTINCNGSGPHTATVTGGPTSFTLDPDADFAPSESCTVTVVAAQVTDQDANDPPDNMASSFVFSFETAGPVCEEPFTPISSIQGSGASAAITGTVTTQGVVVGDFEGGSGLQGFYLQDLTGDGDAATSDGIFVFTGSTNAVSAGQVVRVTGFARERFNQTALNGSNSNTSAVTNIVDCGTTGSVTATDIAMPFTSTDYPERFEGMLVRFPQSLVISEYFNYDRFGEIVLALPLAGETRPFSSSSTRACCSALAGENPEMRGGDCSLAACPASGGTNHGMAANPSNTTASL